MCPPQESETSSLGYVRRFAGRTAAGKINGRTGTTLAFSLIATGYCPHITDLTPAKLKERGIGLVLADLDNTLVAYRVGEPEERLLAWKRALDAAGIKLFILSNSRKPTRVKEFAARLDVPYQGHSGKPSPKGFYSALETMGCAAGETIMVGDQIFTDILGANRAGIASVLVRPIRLAGNPGRYLRYAAETPFRLMAKGRGSL